MSTQIEMDDFSRSTAKASSSSTPNIPSTDADDQVVAFWAWASSALLLLLAIPMTLFPQFLLFLAETSGAERRTVPTPLESFLALHAGILLVALALALIFNVPSAPVLVTQSSSRGHPLLAPLSGACVLIAFLSYNTKSVGSLAFFVFLASATIGTWGLWSILFEGSSYKSRKTGADKRTSRFLFGNKAAASAQKKQWKERQAK
ncbi:hypothetical protein B0H21DRAFT_284442 [Amylocystis lapponica]|nr:hypothetical protein B0H21DRAFT_284442 [Amylocystis lapponica]